jgi:hypothetical protein
VRATSHAVSFFIADATRLASRELCSVDTLNRSMLLMRMASAGRSFASLLWLKA